MSPSVQARAKITRRHSSYGRDSCTLRVFEGNPLNLDRGTNAADYGQPLNLDWNSAHIWADCGHIDWELFWERDCLFRGWGWVESRDDWWCAWDYSLQELSNGFHQACCSVPIS